MTLESTHLGLLVAGLRCLSQPLPPRSGRADTAGDAAAEWSGSCGEGAGGFSNDAVITLRNVVLSEVYARAIAGWRAGWSGWRGGQRGSRWSRVLLTASLSAL